MKPIVLLCTVGLAAAACTPNEITPPPPRAGETRPAPPAPAPKPPPVAKAPAPKAPAPKTSRPDPSDTCGARELQYLVGRPKTEIPVPVNPKNRRVTCTTCPITLDFSPQRVNILFDQATGIVREVRCG